MRVEAPFIDEISGLAIIKILDKNVQNTMMLKLQLTWNLATLDITNSCLDTIIFYPKNVRNIRFKIFGLLKIKEGILSKT